MLLEMTTKTVLDFIFKSWNVYINVLLTYLLSSCLQWRFRFSKFFITTDVCTVVMRSVGFVCVSVCVSVCLRVSVCPVRALIFEILDLETSFLVCGYIFGISTSLSFIKAMGSMSRPQKQKKSHKRN